VGDTTDVQCFARRAVIWNGRRIDVRFALLDDRLTCVGLEIGPHLKEDQTFEQTNAGGEPIEDLRPLTAAEMRFPFRTIVDTAIEHAVMQRSIPAGVPFAESSAAFGDDMTTLKRLQAKHRPGPGRPALYGPDHYEQVADTYREHLAAGGRAPTKAVAERFSVSKSAAAKWVAKAREIGALAEPRRV
jgi:hypothetical protein